MTRPIWEFDFSHALRGAALAVPMTLIQCPVVTGYLFTGKHSRAYAEMGRVVETCWPQWCDSD